LKKKEKAQVQDIKECKCSAPGLGGTTKLHSDLGLITVTPIATAPGIRLTSQDATSWLDAESGVPPIYYNIFIGETFSRIMRYDQIGIKSPLHFVYETPGVARFSTPFYLRAKQSAVIGKPFFRNFNQITKDENFETNTVENFIESVVLERPWAPTPIHIAEGKSDY